MQQLSLDLFPRSVNPSWDDVSAGTARVVTCDPYSKRCHDGCIWYGFRFQRCGSLTCYLFQKPICNGMCPSSTQIEWKD